MLICEITVHIPDNEWMSQNSRTVWQVKARKTKAVKARAIMLGRSWMNEQPKQAARLRNAKRVHVTAIAHMKTNGRYDPENTAPMVKAIIDGFTKAGFWPDDDYRHLTGPDYRAGDKCDVKGFRAITIRIESEDTNE